MADGVGPDLNDARSMGLVKRGFRRLVQSEMARRVYFGSRRVPLIGNYLHSVVDRALPHGSRVWIRIPGGAARGLWFHADPRFEPSYLAGSHEPWVQRLLASRLRAGDCYYDVGAHKGFFTVIAGRLVSHAGAVFAFEPDPENAAILRQNALANKMLQVQVIESALWSRSGTVTFTRVLSHHFAGFLGRVSSDARAPGCEQIARPTVRLDDFIFEHKRRPPGLIKIDVEGGEWEVLEGAGRTLAEIRPHLICEVHDANQVKPLLSFLAGFGYSCQHWDPVEQGCSGFHQHYIWTNGVPA